jgi:hypothetical protein
VILEYPVGKRVEIARKASPINAAAKRASMTEKPSCTTMLRSL